MRSSLVILFLLSFFCIHSQDRGAVHKGVYMIYENISYRTKLNQKIPSSEFNELFNAEINTYPNLKLGYSITAWGNLGLTDWTVWGVDLGFGLNYSKSIMNALYSNQNYNPITNFEPAIKNNQLFFDFYQIGNQCEISDYGLNIHFDAGTIIYVGAEIDAGLSGILFTDNRISGQQVKSLGWFANGRVQGGISLPMFLKVERNVKINFKAYAVIQGWSSRYYKMDWISTDKKLKNFSTIQTDGSPLGLGLSMTILFKSNN